MAKSNAENVAAWRARQKAMPLLARLGFPDLADRFAADTAELENLLAELQEKAANLNHRIAAEIQGTAEEGPKVKALAELQKSRRVNLDAF